MAGCGDGQGGVEPGPAGGPTYYADAKAIVDARCATCHRPGDIGPFPLTTFAEVKAFAGPVRAAVESGTMPPWQPSDECNSYQENIDLTAAEKELLLAWLKADAPEGNLDEAPASTPPASLGFEADLSLQLPEPYTPTREPDDYRCQLIPWPAEDTRFVTGLRVMPDQRAIVHHVIVFVVGPEAAEQYRGFDAAEEGPGYTCYGGPRANTGGGLGNVDPAVLFAALNELGLTVADVQSGNLTEEQFLALAAKVRGDEAVGLFRSIGSWVPGAPAGRLPAGTGIRVEPGSLLVAQFHYNTLTSAPVADQSRIEIATAPSVEREATILPAVDLGWVSQGLIREPMTIPAGAANVQHSTTLAYDSVFVAGARRTLNLSEDAPLVIHRANHHMHELGTSQRTELRHADGTKSCVLDIPDWDFHWQGSYTLAEPVTIRPGDSLWMGCTWDNTAANQPIIDGQARTPANVAWGEGTSDEMCLGAFYVTAE
ncbi:MAG: monooxygenase [Deltaproteobacteria bacterium]|nr:monooxygenase [Deltaproteobacteria bacterium]